MMNKKNLLHILTAVSFAVFIALGLASASGKTGPGEASMLYFEANGGTGPVPSSQKVTKDASFTLPGAQGLSFGNASFGGWVSYDENDTATIYRAGESFTPSGGTFILYAKWVLDAPDLESADSFANKLIWLQNNAETNGNYILEINANETIGPQSLSFPGKKNITITLRGIGANRTISFTTRQYHNVFVIGPSVTFILDNNITFQTKHDRSFVNVIGTLIMNDGSTIICNGDEGVEVSSGTFTMNGGTITGCRNGVVIGSGMGSSKKPGTFNMNGGSITKNNGSGVVLAIGTFAMIGGTISNNIRIGDGAGVNVGFPLGNSVDAIFNMSGGNIEGNEAQSQADKDGRKNFARGGGVYVDKTGRFTITGGTITRNKANEGANGVFASTPGSYVNKGGTVQTD